MKQFANRITLNPNQRREVERYLGMFTVNTEFGFLMLVRKIKKIEEKLNEKRY